MQIYIKICVFLSAMKQILLALAFLIGTSSGIAQTSIALLKYNGGGDWYANPTALPNLIKFCNEQAQMNLNTDYATVEVGSQNLFNYPWVHLTGHGNIVCSDAEVENLRRYLEGGGFLHIDDNYGLDVFIRPLMKKVFPDLDFVELPYSHPIYHQKYDFPQGLPKIHEHDNKRPQGFALIKDARVLCFYTYECDLGDGWEDAEVHNDSENKRQKALQMGLNIIQFAFMQ